MVKQRCSTLLEILSKSLKLKQWDIEVSEAEANGAALTSPHSYFNTRCDGNPSTTDLLELTLRAEIAAEVTSPEADQARRMSLQIDMMNRGERTAPQAKAMLQSWCASGPKSAQHDPLRERFFAAVAALPSAG